MNVICNSCVGARIYQAKKLQFNNPFIWSIVPSDDFIYLAQNYDNINFHNYVLDKDHNGLYKVIVDNKINIVYPHYKFASNCLTPQRIQESNNQLHIYYNKIEEYIIEKYNSRLVRMNSQKPIFLFVQKINYGYDITNEDIQIFDNINIPYKKIVYTDRVFKLHKSVYIKNSIQASTIGIANAILNNHMVQNIMK